MNFRQKSLKSFQVVILLSVVSCAAGRFEKTGSTAAADDVSRGVEKGFEPVAFLIGDWDGTGPGGRYDEHWIAPRGGMMLGLGREVDGQAKATFFELIRIERRAEKLVMAPHPMGKPPRDFLLTQASPGSAVFENAGDDRVSKISYALAGDQLVIRVEFRSDGHVEEFHLHRVER